MPALVNSSVGSLAGTSEEECTSLCPLETKKSRNMRRTSEPESLRVGIGVEEILAFVLAAGLISNVALVSEPQILRLARGGLAQDDKSEQSANFCGPHSLIVNRQLVFVRQPSSLCFVIPSGGGPVLAAEVEGSAVPANCDAAHRCVETVSGTILW